MVSAGIQANPPGTSGGTNSTAFTPIRATCTLQTHLTFPMHKWRPRSGRNADYKKWERSLRELLAAFACTESMLAAGPPQVDSSSHDAMTLRSGEKIEVDTTAHELQTAALVEWQSVNTALYWHVKPSLLIDGPDFERDARKTDLYSGRLANGWKLIEWARGHADVSGNYRSALTTKAKPTH